VRDTLSLDLDLVLVECNVVLDVRRLLFGIWVVPGDILDAFPSYVGVVIRGGSFPWTNGASSR